MSFLSTSSKRKPMLVKAKQTPKLLNVAFKLALILAAVGYVKEKVLIFLFASQKKFYNIEHLNGDNINNNTYKYVPSFLTKVRLIGKLHRHRIDEKSHVQSQNDLA